MHITFICRPYATKHLKKQIGCNLFCFSRNTTQFAQVLCDIDRIPHEKTDDSLFHRITLFFDVTTKNIKL